ncbi:MAG: glycosyltransferase family 4 protein [Deltaproteobacteria bacterium]|nr:glycosyltransferase family 4 protein [Deltaproteobacteria bacterium]
MRLAIVRTHPTQYFSPLFRSLSKVPGLEVKVFYCLPDRGRGGFDPGFNQKIFWDVDLLEGYQYEFVPTAPLPFKPKHIFESRSPKLIKKLKEGNFNAVFCAGYALWLDWQMIFFALRNKIPLICRPEFNELGVHRGWLKTWIRKKILTWYFSKVSAFLYIGQKAREGFLSFGGNPSKAFFSPYSVNNNLFDVCDVRSQSKTQLKTEFGFQACDLVLLYVGKLIQQKGVDLLIQAIKRLEDKLKVGLLMVGDGPQSEMLLSKIKNLKLEHFHFAGFQNQSQLPKYYQVGDVLIIPSLVEPWGLVVNEAMASGTPVIASDRVGSAYDLVEEGKTGYMFEAENSHSLALTIEKFYQRSIESGFSGDYIRTKVSQYSIDRSVSGFTSALNSFSKTEKMCDRYQ